MKTWMRVVLVGLLCMGSVAYANNGKHKTAKAKHECPSNCDKTKCEKKTCRDGEKNCAQLHCSKKS